MMKRTSIAVILATALSLGGGARLLFAQEASRPAVATAHEDSVNKMNVIFHTKIIQRLMLQRVLNSLNSLDSTFLSHCPVWVIRDEDIKERMYKAFRNRHANPPRESNVVVLTDPGRTDILEISMGPATLSRRDIKLTLSDSLMKDVLLMPNVLKLSERRNTNVKLTKPFDTQPSDVSLEMSLFGASLRFGNGWGTQVKVGNDELGYPFWLSGKADFMVMIQEVRFGFSLPITSGLEEKEIIGPVALRPRKLNGAPGIVLEYDQPVDSNVVGGRFSIGELTDWNALSDLTDSADIPYIHTSAQVSVARKLRFNGNEHVLSLKGGLGLHQIGHGVAEKDGSIATTGRSTFVSPLAAIEYVHNGLETYGISVQYYNSIIVSNAWLELVKDIFYIELKYASPVFRGPRPWEQSYFIMVSPRVRFAF